MSGAVAWCAAVLAFGGAPTAAPVDDVVGLNATVSALPVTERPPAGFSGGFGEPSCVHCHIGNDVNAFGGRVALEGLPAMYEPGHEYVLSVRLEAEETTLAGFQLTARHSADGRGNAGALRPIDGRTGVSDSLGIRYMHHTREGASTADPNGSSWQFVWTAPAEATPVVFNVSANSGNGDNSPLGDLVFVHEAPVSANSRGPSTLSAPGH